MIKVEDFFECFLKEKVDFFTGVPDSLLKSFCAYLLEKYPEKHIIAANEGNAISIAAGHYLATNKIGLVYLQNSGLGNCVNPLTSLTDKEVYSIPLIMLIGWRGEPGEKDEPQHIKQGRIMLDMLKVLEIPYAILPKDFENAKQIISDSIKYSRKEKTPFAIIVKKNTFEKYQINEKEQKEKGMSREDAIKSIVDSLSKKDIIISTTGKTSRELFEYREKLNQTHEKDFLTVGSMGHSSSIALGISLNKKNKKIICLDGDGAVIMHMGSLTTIGAIKPENFIHVVLNNYSYDSVGGQPTSANSLDFAKIASDSGYLNIKKVNSSEDIKNTLNKFKKKKGPSFIEVIIKKGARKNLKRPTNTPKQNKEIFEKFLQK